MPSLVIFLSHSKDPEGFLLDRVANLSDVAGVVRVIGLSREVCVLELFRVVDKVRSGWLRQSGSSR